MRRELIESKLDEPENTEEIEATKQQYFRRQAEIQAMTQEFVLNLIKNPDLFSNIVYDKIQLRGILEKFPQHAHDLLEFTHSPEEFKRLIVDLPYLFELIEKVPSRIDDLVTPILTNSDEFIRIVGDARHFFKCFERFPQKYHRKLDENYEDYLLDRAFAEAEPNNLLLDIGLNSLRISNRFPHYKEALTERYKETIVNRALYNFHLFKKIISTYYDNFLYLINFFPEYRYQLFEHFINNPEDFIMQFNQYNQEQIEACIESLPRYRPVFENFASEDITVYLNNIRNSHDQIEKSVEALCSLAESPSCYLSRFEKTLLWKEIAAFTGEATAYDGDENEVKDHVEKIAKHKFDQLNWG